MFHSNGVGAKVIDPGQEADARAGEETGQVATVERAAPRADIMVPEPATKVAPGGPISRPVTARFALRIERTDASFTHLHTAIEFATSATAARTEELADASLLRPGRSVLIGVTSAIAGEGKTTVALHLAMDIARNNFKKVCLIDLALGDDTLSRRLGVPSSRGLVHVLEGVHHAIPTLESDEIEGLCVMPAGKAPANAARAARAPALAEILAASRELFDVTIVDLPAIATGNTLPILQHLDAYIVVTVAGVTPRNILQEALEQLDKKKLLGVVLNRTTSPTPRWLQKRLRH